MFQIFSPKISFIGKQIFAHHQKLHCLEKETNSAWKMKRKSAVEGNAPNSGMHYKLFSVLKKYT